MFSSRVATAEEEGEEEVTTKEKRMSLIQCRKHWVRRSTRSASQPSPCMRRTPDSPDRTAVQGHLFCMCLRKAAKLSFPPQLWTRHLCGGIFVCRAATSEPEHPGNRSNTRFAYGWHVLPHTRRAAAGVHVTPRREKKNRLA